MEPKESKDVVTEQDEVVVKDSPGGYVVTEPVQTPEEKRIQKRLLLKIDILFVSLISLIMLVNQWVRHAASRQRLYKV